MTITRIDGAGLVKPSVYRRKTVPTTSVAIAAER
jgi:hypothetical protein